MKQKIRDLISIFEVLGAVKITFFWTVTPCGLFRAEDVYPIHWYLPTQRHNPEK
jgi:hypothetical protein